MVSARSLLPRSLSVGALCALAVACQRPSPATGAADAARPVDTAPSAPPPPRIFTIERKCMGTKCQVKAFHSDEKLVERAVDRGLAEMDRIEALTTSWTNDSDVAHVNQVAGQAAVKVAPDTME